MQLSSNHPEQSEPLHAELEFPVLAGVGPAPLPMANESRWEAYFQFGSEDIQEALLAFLRQYLMPPLQESDLADILRGVANFLDPRSQVKQQFQDVVTIPIPGEQLSQQLHSHLASYLDEVEIAEVIEFMAARIHQQLQFPRSNWPEPLWVFEAQGQRYITQAVNVELAKAKVDAQYPELGEQQLVLVEVSGLLTPDPVIRVAAPSAA